RPGRVVGVAWGIFPLVRIVDCVTPCGLSIPMMPRPSSIPRLGLDVGLRRRLDRIAAARLRPRRFLRGLALQRQCIEAGVDASRRARWVGEADQDVAKRRAGTEFGGARGEHAAGDVTRGPGLRILARENADDVLGIATPTNDAGRQERDAL